MSTCDSEDTVEASVASLRSQSFRSFSLHIRDASFGDNTEFLCRNLVRSDSRISYERVEPGTSWYVNSRAHLERCNAKFISWTDPDDLWSSNWLELLHKTLITTSDQAAFGRLRHIDLNGNSALRHPADEMVFSYSGVGSRRMRLLGHFLTPESLGGVNMLYALWRTDKLRALDPWVGDHTRDDLDVEFIARALARGPIDSVAEASIYRRLSREGWQSATPMDGSQRRTVSALNFRKCAFKYLRAGRSFGLRPDWGRQYRAISEGDAPLNAAIGLRRAMYVPTQLAKSLLNHTHGA